MQFPLLILIPAIISDDEGNGDDGVMQTLESGFCKCTRTFIDIVA